MISAIEVDGLSVQGNGFGEVLRLKSHTVFVDSIRDDLYIYRGLERERVIQINKKKLTQTSCIFTLNEKSGIFPLHSHTSQMLGISRN